MNNDENTFTVILYYVKSRLDTYSLMTSFISDRRGCWSKDAGCGFGGKDDNFCTCGGGSVSACQGRRLAQAASPRMTSDPAWRPPRPCPPCPRPPRCRCHPSPGVWRWRACRGWRGLAGPGCPGHWGWCWSPGRPGQGRGEGWSNPHRSGSCNTLTPLQKIGLISWLWSFYPINPHPWSSSLRLSLAAWPRHRAGRWWGPQAGRASAPRRPRSACSARARPQPPAASSEQPEQERIFHYPIDLDWSIPVLPWPFASPGWGCTWRTRSLCTCSSSCDPWARRWPRDCDSGRTWVSGANPLWSSSCIRITGVTMTDWCCSSVSISPQSSPALPLTFPHLVSGSPASDWPQPRSCPLIGGESGAGGRGRMTHS